MFFNNCILPMHSRQRAAFSLVEMLVGITLSASIMLTAVALVHRAFEHHKTVVQRVQQTNAFQRFVERFRGDVHGALTAHASADGVQLIGSSGEQITYTSREHELTRIYLQGEQQYRERVELSPSATAKFAVETDPPLVVLSLNQQRSTTPLQLPRRIAVAVGRLTERFTAGGQQSPGGAKAEVQR